MALTFFLTWVPWGLVAVELRAGQRGAVTPLILLGGFGPMLAAIVVAGVSGDAHSWLGNLVDVRTSLWVWFAAISVPVVLYR